MPSLAPQLSAQAATIAPKWLLPQSRSELVGQMNGVAGVEVMLQELLRIRAEIGGPDKAKAERERKLAERKLRATQVAVDEDRYEPPSNATVNDVVDEWLASLRRRSTTHRQYETTLAYARAVFGTKRIRKVSTADVLAFLRVIANPSDELSLERIVNVPPRGLGDTSIKQMQTWAVGNATNLWGALSRAGDVPGLASRAINAAKQFVSMIESGVFTPAMYRGALRRP